MTLRSDVFWVEPIRFGVMDVRLVGPASLVQGVRIGALGEVVLRLNFHAMPPKCEAVLPVGSLPPGYYHQRGEHQLLAAA